MIFLTDECVQAPVVALWRTMEALLPKPHIREPHEIVTVEDRYGRATPDENWMLDASKWSPKPIVVSGDTAILSKNKVKRAMFRECAFVWFALADAWENMEFNTLMWKATKVWPEITVAAAHATPPRVFRVRAKNEDIEDITSQIY